MSDTYSSSPPVSDDEDELESIVSIADYIPSIEVAHYITGISRDKRPVVAALMPTNNGWTCRSNYTDMLRYNYVNHEPIDTITDTWIPRDFRRGTWTLTTDRDEVIEHLSTILESSASLPETALVGDPMMPVEDAAEVVLQHLELGK